MVLRVKDLKPMKKGREISRPMLKRKKRAISVEISVRAILLRAFIMAKKIAARIAHETDSRILFL